MKTFNRRGSGNNSCGAGHAAACPSVASGRAGKGKRQAAKSLVSVTPGPVPPTATPVVAVTYADGRRTPLELYLREIGQVPLLTRLEETKLARKIRRGDGAAREHMIKANLRLVVKIARDYEGLGLPLLDLVNEGNMGLMKGVERFNPAKGAKLSTYAAWWIKQSIKRALANQSKTIRLPVHVVDKIAQIRRCEAQLHDALGRVPTNEEVSDEIGVPAKRIAQYREASMQLASLDAPIGHDDDSNRVADIVADQNAHTPYEDLEGKTDTQLVQTVLASLDERERAILRHRFGLNGNDERTLEEVGEEFGVTRERIRQIQNEALLKLRKKIQRLESSGHLMLME